MNRLNTILLVVALALSSCKKGDQGPAGPLLTGAIQGFALLFDEDAERLTNHSGVTVSIGNGFSAVTDSSGTWRIEGVSTGTYEITYSKAGYGTWKKPTVQFVGGGDFFDGVVQLFELPSHTVVSFSVDTSSFDNMGRIDISGSLSRPNSYFVVFFHNQSSVSSNLQNHLYSHGLVSSPNSTFNTSISVSQLEYNGIHSGMTIYLKAYPCSRSFATYSDPLSGKLVFPNLGATGSSVVNVIIP